MAQLSNHLNYPRTYIKSVVVVHSHLVLVCVDIWAEGYKHVNVTGIAGFMEATLCLVNFDILESCLGS